MLDLQPGRLLRTLHLVPILHLPVTLTPTLHLHTVLPFGCAALRSCAIATRVQLRDVTYLIPVPTVATTITGLWLVTVTDLYLPLRHTHITTGLYRFCVLVCGCRCRCVVRLQFGYLTHTTALLTACTLRIRGYLLPALLRYAVVSTFVVAVVGSLQFTLVVACLFTDCVLR